MFVFKKKKHTLIVFEVTCFLVSCGKLFIILFKCRWGWFAMQMISCVTGPAQFSWLLTQSVQRHRAPKFHSAGICSGDLLDLTTVCCSALRRNTQVSPLERWKRCLHSSGILSIRSLRLSPGRDCLSYNLKSHYDDVNPSRIAGKEITGLWYR